jgi:hypothetical protein
MTALCVVFNQASLGRRTLSEAPRRYQSPTALPEWTITPGLVYRSSSPFKTVALRTSLPGLASTRPS